MTSSDGRFSFITLAIGAIAAEGAGLVDLKWCRLTADVTETGIKDGGRLVPIGAVPATDDVARSVTPLGGGGGGARRSSLASILAVVRVTKTCE